MKAMILSAGLGTRLRPLTNDRPKALIEINGEPMLGKLIKRLAGSGFNELIINVHHLGDQIINFLDQNNDFGGSISISDESDLLLDTGGGLKNAQGFFADHQPFLVYNVDIFSDMNLSVLMDHHRTHKPLATLVVRDRESSRYLLFDDQMILCGWENVFTGERILARKTETIHRYAFSGIHVISPEIFSLITENGVFSIIEVYLRLAGEHIIQGYSENESMWIDLGKKEGLIEAEKQLLKKK